MKKIIGFLLGLFSVCALSACDLSAILGGMTSDSAPASSSEIVESGEHKHSLTRKEEVKATCAAPGNITYWTCDCGAYFSDAMGAQEISAEDVVVAQKEHELTHSQGFEATCQSTGRMEYWSCSVCKNYYADEECTQLISKTQVLLTKTAHDLTHYEEIPVNGKENGVKEHWVCGDCGGYFADANGKKTMTQADTVLYSVLNIPDFVVEVPVGRDPVVLQLSDTQIIDAAQARPGRDGVDYNYFATDKLYVRCFDYITEVVNATNPDFIIITGDVIYGEFDDNGSSLMRLINFMDSFQIPWSPVFGNHDNESKMGVDWQCQQLENSPYCLFEQKELSGNGNYSVGIAQGGELKRVFYMMDSNGCGNASAESKANGHTLSNFVGFKPDQIDWYTNQIETLKDYAPDVKISFAYHIQQAVFGDAYAKYGFDQGQKYQDINLDTMDDVAESDFGYIGRPMKGPWDTGYKVYEGMKKLGVDSIFVGHEHCNNVSVVYEGIRFTYGLKTSEYDRFNFINTDGTVGGNYGYAMPKTSTPLVGGTVIVLSEDSGAIEDCYNYYCGFENGKVDWSAYAPEAVITVNGLQYGGVNVQSAQMYADGQVVAEAVEFNGVNAYKVTAEGQGKLYVNTALLKGKTTFTFTLYMENAVGQYELNPFAIRIKPDDGAGANIPGMFFSGSSNKQYIRYMLDTDVEEVRLQLGVWKTYTVDITDIAEGCTEFSFNIAQGNVMYLKDIALS